MIDPNDPLAHLYGDLDDGLDDGLDDEVLAVRKMTLDDLNEEGPEEEILSDSDVDELALLVKAHHDAGTASDELLAALGLGEWTPYPPGDPTFDLNRAGLAVTRRLAEWEGLIPRGTGPTG